jgi:hypothetical protein
MKTTGDAAPRFLPVLVETLDSTGAGTGVNEIG